MFSPLNPTLDAECSVLPTLRGVVFDMDGTLCEPQIWMFARMRQALGIEKGIDILEHILSLSPEDQHTADESIKAIEREAMVQMTAQPGLLPLMEYLASRGIRKAICTRNFDRPVQHLLDTFLTGIEISPIVTREFRPLKPDPAGIQHISQVWGIPTSEMIMVGDSLDDMLAGRRAGTRTVLLLAGSGSNAHAAKDESTDCIIDRLDDLIDLLENGTLSLKQ